MQQRKPQIIIGIDPGTRITGYGIIKQVGQKSEALDFGCIRPPVASTAGEKYKIIFNSIDHLLEIFQPHAVAVETQFVYKNVQSAMKLGMARGMVLLAAALRNIPLYEFAPRKAKLAVVGNGGASKQQVQKMIQVLLSLPQAPHPEDAADALALAICCAHHLKWETYV